MKMGPHVIIMRSLIISYYSGLIVTGTVVAVLVRFDTVSNGDSYR